jgi:transposase-like protein
LRRHGISRLPRDPEKASKRRRFAETAIGYVHIDVCELRLSEGRLFMFLAIDRVSKFTHVAFYDANTKLNGAAFLRQVVATFPYAIHTVLTDNGMAFADLPRNRGRHPEIIEAIFGGHIFDRVCDEHGIEHRLTKPYHPWTNGQAERMNRTVKEATIKAFHYPDLEALQAHVLAFVTAYNFAKHLKALRWRTPFQAVCDAWKADPSAFKIDPHHLIPGTAHLVGLIKAKVDSGRYASTSEVVREALLLLERVDRARRTRGRRNCGRLGRGGRQRRCRAARLRRP